VDNVFRIGKIAVYSLFDCVDGWLSLVPENVRDAARGAGLDETIGIECSVTGARMGVGCSIVVRLR
jgi:hypothetical protein